MSYLLVLVLCTSFESKVLLVKLLEACAFKVGDGESQAQKLLFSKQKPSTHDNIKTTKSDA